MAVRAVFTYTCDTCGKVAVVEDPDVYSGPEGWADLPGTASMKSGNVCSIECARPWIEQKVTAEMAKRFPPVEVPA